MSTEDISKGVDLSGQVALVTGAGRGIGRAMAQALVGAGASVALVARSPEQLEETARLIGGRPGQVLTWAADVTDEQAVRRLVEETASKLGPIDLLVANAGVSAPNRPFWETPISDTWRTLDVNLRGVMISAQAALPGMIDRRQGRIVVTGSYSGVRPNPSGLAYSVSKTAVLRFAEALANEVRPHGVKVFSISPGLVHTAMTEPAWQAQPPEKRVVSAAATSNPTSDWSPPSLAAELVVYLASGQADSLSGRFIHSRSDDVVEMARRATEIEQQDLYTLRLNTLK